jgi:hypothetical protein
MVDFSKVPEALDYVAGQAWLSPLEPVATDRSRAATGVQRGAQPLHWRDAVRQIVAIVKRTKLA